MSDVARSYRGNINDVFDEGSYLWSCHVFHKKINYRLVFYKIKTNRLWSMFGLKNNAVPASLHKWLYECCIVVDLN